MNQISPKILMVDTLIGLYVKLFGNFSFCQSPPSIPRTLFKIKHNTTCQVSYFLANQTHNGFRDIHNSMTTAISIASVIFSCIKQFRTML
jgi:hypothetical protein